MLHGILKHTLPVSVKRAKLFLTATSAPTESRWDNDFTFFFVAFLASPLRPACPVGVAVKRIIHEPDERISSINFSTDSREGFSNGWIDPSGVWR